MTAQIGDIYKYENKEYNIVALSMPTKFKPEKYGLKTDPSSTACWRGYWCEYNIIKDGLFLETLFLHNNDEDYPTLNGVDVLPQEFIECECYDMKDEKWKKTIRPAYYGHRVYKNINLPMKYSGKILLGDGFIREYYFHMGYQQGWAYKRLIELVLKKGKLVECNDLSELAKEQRKKIRELEINYNQSKNDNIWQYVRNSFSLKYKDKAWWIKE